ncbi:LacI family DNA-binding transcriptional regulator [Paenibacillus polymyxa]|uniref:LacI family DNA-binding transcriptional regulator n=1 Tax=Paenibacillus TaxID=44249 RepID=UPI000F4F6F49|nr:MULTISPECIES: LacI family DNA-binding transcriptional regulator [Paenibacillus]KAF6655216.1 LacI family DNA-binding transcriptional regulator [Paenibacillus sp. EKM301P]RPE03954.1 LacI family DNA-binding transcriptional regulator [Paenibacillus polymyxa]UBS89557.1 LacI family DNA-binding transcriptional regulator [Paenibacillus polymyxa]WHX33460.1 LacI family DNA-binding transcriptional regulator [Paenibacillus polymyxa]
MANINDIAKRAGVSVSTVSRVLNHNPYVSESKRLAVQRVIDEMDYTPNRLAVDLIRKETRSIGVIIPHNNNQAFDQMLHGILNQSVELGYTVIVLPTKYDADKELSYMSMLKSKQLDGIIITSRSNPWELLTPFANYGTIVACEFTEHPEIGCAYMDRYASFVEAFSLLKDKGHTRVAFTTARGEESNSTRLTIKAYQHVFGNLLPEHHVSNCYNINDGIRAAQQLLNTQHRPTAVYANGDEVATGIYQYVRSVQLLMPDDFAIIGQENQPVGVGLGLTTVDHRLVQVGEQAFNLAIQKSTDKLEIPYRIIVRQST